jgi:hypothetical protein
MKLRGGSEVAVNTVFGVRCVGPVRVEDTLVALTLAGRIGVGRQPRNQDVTRLV